MAMAGERKDVEIDPLFGEDYHDTFVPATFLAERYKESDLSDAGKNVHILRALHDLFQSRSLRHPSSSSVPAPPSLRVLDFGAGPVIMCAISAARWASEIVFSDLAESCRIAVKRWLQKDPNAHDWTPYFRHVVQSLEGHREEEEVAARQELVRVATKAVVSCDITKDPPIEEGYEGPYDVVIANLVLVASCKTLDDYAKGVSKLSGLLKPGGTIFIVSEERKKESEGTWPVGSTKWFCMHVTEGDVVSSLQRAGCGDIEVKRIPWPDRPYMNALLIVTATKN